MSKVLIYTENYLPGGGNRYLIDIVNSIDSDKEVFILSNKNGLFPFDLKRIKREYNYQEIPVITLPLIYSKLKKQKKIIRLSIGLFIKCFRFFLVFLLKKKNTLLLNNKIEVIKPEIIFSCNGGYPGGYTCFDLILAANKNNTPVISTVVSVPQNSTGRIFNFFYDKVISHSQNIVVNTSIISKTFITNYPSLENKFTTINNCIDMKEFADLDSNFGKTFKSKYNCGDSTIIGFTGRVEELKGIYVLLKAFSMVLQTNKNIKLVVVGSGEIEEAKQFSQSIGIAKNVVFTGFFDGNIYDVINSFDIFVFPSLWEGLPYAILEAMALKKIIVSTNVGGIPEVIESEVSGLLVNPNDSDQLAAELIRVVENFDTFERLGLQAYEKVTLKLSLSGFSKKINKLINSTLQKETVL